MDIIIVTGKSGSGKSHLSAELALLLDGKHLPLDKVSHMALETKMMKDFIKKEFGTSVFADKNTIDRKKLGAIAFANPEKLEKLNNLSEKIMEQIIDQEIATCKNRYLILDYMLLPKMKYFNMPSIKILLKCDTDTRKRRILNRDNILEEYFYSRDKHSLEYNPEDFNFVLNSAKPIDYENLSILIEENY